LVNNKVISDLEKQCDSKHPSPNLENNYEVPYDTRYPRRFKDWTSLMGSGNDIHWILTSCAVALLLKVASVVLPCYFTFKKRNKNVIIYVRFRIELYSFRNVTHIFIIVATE
jgi:hypothetical protein